MLKTFKIGGIHPNDNKLSKGCAIEKMPLPEKVVISLSQHIGAPATATVAKGDKVKVGDLIGKATGFVSADVHSSVSGTVVAVDAQPDTSGVRKPSVTIAVEGDEWNEQIDLGAENIPDISAKEMMDAIAHAGIVGMGGATFPTNVKLSVPDGKKAEFLIINGVECEPYLTADHRVMLERPDDLLKGVAILCKVLSVKKAFIGIENNKPDAIELLTKKAAGGGYGDVSIEVVPLKVQYPQGGEKQLIDAVIGRQVPSGALPIEVGAVVQNAGTAVAVYEAVVKHKPLIERVVTVTGKSLASPKNLLVRLGTPVQALIDYCGGLGDNTGKVINGGPMMGRAACNLEGGVTKGTSGVLLMNDGEAKRKPSSPCIRCAKCVSVCPMGLEPYLINVMTKNGLVAQTEPLHPYDCIECGSCSYTCPAGIPLLDFIRLAKGEVMKIMRARKS